MSSTSSARGGLSVDVAPRLSFGDRHELLHGSQYGAARLILAKRDNFGENEQLLPLRTIAKMPGYAMRRTIRPAVTMIEVMAAT